MQLLLAILRNDGDGDGVQVGEVGQILRCLNDRFENCVGSRVCCGSCFEWVLALSDLAIANGYCFRQARPTLIDER